MRWGRRYGEVYVPFAQFFCEPKTVNSIQKEKGRQTDIQMKSPPMGGRKQDEKGVDFKIQLVATSEPP